MAGRRPLDRSEERKLLRVVRTLSPRDRAWITALWFSGFRLGEILTLTVGHVWRHGMIVPQIGVSPRHLKGKRGRTRWVPVSPEVSRALRQHLWWMRLKFELTPAMPLFPSRQAGPDGGLRPITRVQAHTIIKRVFAKAAILDHRLGSHTFRKTLAANSFAHSKSYHVLKGVLGHAHAATSELYLEEDQAAVCAAIASCDFTRRPRRPVQTVIAQSAREPGTLFPEPIKPKGGEVLAFIPPAEAQVKGA